MIIIMQHGTPEFTDLHRQILDFEAAWWKYPGAKDAAIRDRFGVSPTRHYQVLNGLLDQPAAEAYAPMTVRRLRRLRDQRAASRAAQRDGFAVPR